MAWIVLAVMAFLAVGTLMYGVGMYNGLIRLKHAVERSWSNIDVLLKQRHDELPKLVDTVKGYMAHEKEILIRVTEARARPEALAEANYRILWIRLTHWPSLHTNDV